MPGNFRPSADVDYKGTIGGYSPLYISQAAVNFNTSNDNNSISPRTPTMLAISPTLNDDASVNIKVAWNFVSSPGLSAGNVDGFIVWMYDTDSSGNYTITGTGTDETGFIVNRSSRNYITKGVVSNRYYTFAVQSYRRVSTSINPSGILYSDINQQTPALIQPAAFSNFTGYINGVSPTFITLAATNFNQGNDRNNTTPTAPVMSPTSVVSTNDDASVNVKVSWSYSPTSGLTAANIDGFIVWMYDQAGSGTYTITGNGEDETAFVLKSNRRRHTIKNLVSNRYYTYAVQAYRKVDSDIASPGILYSSLSQQTTTLSRPSATANFTGTISGSPASTVASNAAGAFAGTAKYRTTGAPTNPASPSGITGVQNSNGTYNIKLDWGTYSQGVNQADNLILFWRKDGLAPTINDASITFTVNPASPSYHILEGVNPEDIWSFGIAASRRTENGLEIGSIVAPTSNPDWRGVTYGTPNYTANLNGSPAAKIQEGTLVYRDGLAPNGSSPSVSGTPGLSTSDGNVITTITYSYNNSGTRRADFYVIYVKEGGGTVTTGDPAFVTNASNGIMTLGVKPNTNYTFGFSAARATRNGYSSTAITTSSQVTTVSPNFTGTLDGVSVTTVVANAAAGAAGVTNFNTRNDRNSLVPSAPTFSPNGEAVDHTLNSDSSANISFEWNYSPNSTPSAQNNIDGFIVYVKADSSPASTSSYTFGTSPMDEVTYTVDAERRAFVLPGVPADRFYRFGVRAYRLVDDDVSAGGIIYSSISKPSHSTESPYYRPTAQIAFEGNLTGTIAGSPASTVVGNVNTVLTGTTELRNTSPPGALPSIGTIVSSPTADGNVVVTIPVTYTQGTPIADGMVLYYKEGATGANSKTNDHRGFSFDPDDSSTVRNFKVRLEPNTQYNFSARAYRRAEGGRKYTAFTSLATHTTVSPNYTGSLNGTPVATVISNAASGAAVATDFNASNNRNTSPINFAPVIAADGTAVDHVLNNNGSADLSFEWTWGGNEANIDGFMVYLKANTATGAYNWGTSPTDETIIDVAANKRVLAVYGVSVDKYYHFGVRAYRKVDESLANTGSAINGIVANPSMSAQPVKPTWSGAGPESTGYQPSSTVSFSGTLSGTVGSVATGNVNVWSAIGGTGKPEDNATFGATAGTNLKDQSGNQVSASTDGSPNTIFIKQNTIKIYDASGVLRVKIGNLAG